MWYVYITKNQNGSFYTGGTRDLTRRFEEHCRGKGGQFTKYCRPEKIFYSEEFESILDAERRESQIKGWTRAKKIALINGNIDGLKVLSSSRH